MKTNPLTMFQSENPDFEILKKVYKTGLLEQTPPPDSTKDEELDVMLRRSAIMEFHNENGEISGLLLYSTPKEAKEPTCHLDFLYAVEKGKGIAQFMLSVFAKQMLNWGWEKARLEVSVIDPRATRFYEKVGFKKVGEEQREIKLDVLEIDLELLVIKD